MLKINHLENTTVERAFAAEAELVKAVKQQTCEHALLLWQTNRNTLVYPAGAKFPKPDTLAPKLAALDWQLCARSTGGAPVPQMPGVLNASYIFNWPEDRPYTTKAGYKIFCDKLQAALATFGVSSACHATPGSYCDGDFNINIASQKIIGTAQRVILNGKGGYVVLAQAFILVNANLNSLCNTVNLCYEHINWPDKIVESAHTQLINSVSLAPEKLITSLCLALGKQFSQDQDKL